MIRPSARRHPFFAQGEGGHLNGRATASLNHRRFSDRFGDDSAMDQRRIMQQHYLSICVLQHIIRCPFYDLRTYGESCRARACR